MSGNKTVKLLDAENSACATDWGAERQLALRLAHATEFRYGVFVARKHGHVWRVISDDRSTFVEFEGVDAQDEAIREAAKRGSR